VFREFTGLDALETAVVPDTADITALRRHVTIPVPVFPVRSDASIIPGSADGNVPSSLPGHSWITIRHRAMAYIPGQTAPEFS
jgi:hypothetical protein